MILLPLIVCVFALVYGLHEVSVLRYQRQFESISSHRRQMDALR